MTGFCLYKSLNTELILLKVVLKTKRFKDYCNKKVSLVWYASIIVKNTDFAFLEKGAHGTNKNIYSTWKIMSLTVLYVGIFKI